MWSESFGTRVGWYVSPLTYPRWGQFTLKESLCEQRALHLPLRVASQNGVPPLLRWCWAWCCVGLSRGLGPVSTTVRVLSGPGGGGTPQQGLRQVVFAWKEVLPRQMGPEGFPGARTTRCPFCGARLCLRSGAGWLPLRSQAQLPFLYLVPLSLICLPFPFCCCLQAKYIWWKIPFSVRMCVSPRKKYFRLQRWELENNSINSDCNTITTTDR